MKMTKFIAPALLCLCLTAAAADRDLWTATDAGDRVVYNIRTDDAGKAYVVCGITTNLTITSNGLTLATITLADHSVTTAAVFAIPPGSFIVGGHNSNATIKAMTGAVTLDSNGVTTVTSVNANAIGSTNIAANSILAEDLAALSVDTAALTNGAVTGPKIASGSVSNVAIADDTIDLTKLIPGSPSNVVVVGADSNASFQAMTGDTTIGTNGAVVIVDGALTGPEYTAGSVSNVAVADDTLDLTKLIPGSPSNVVVVGADSNLSYQAMTGDTTIGTNGAVVVVDGAITGPELTAGSVSNVAIAADTIDLVKIIPGSPSNIVVVGADSNMSYQAMTGDTTIGTNGAVVIVDNALTGPEYTAGSVSNAAIAANAVTVAKLTTSAANTNLPLIFIQADVTNQATLVISNGLIWNVTVP